MKKEQKTAITKEKIIKIALDEFGGNGYSGTTLNSICKAGISKGLFYHNFASKDALYLECVKRCFDSLVEFIERQDIGTDPQKYLAVRLEFLRSNKNYARLFFESLMQPPRSLENSINTIKEEFDSLNKKMYMNILNSVKLRNGITYENAMNYFTLMQTMFNGYFSSPISNGISVSECIDLHEEYLSKIIDFMIFGIAERG